MKVDTRQERNVLTEMNRLKLSLSRYHFACLLEPFTVTDIESPTIEIVQSVYLHNILFLLQ